MTPGKRGITTPELLILNEPETSEHGSLIAPLARLMAEAARRSQVLITTHSNELADALADLTGAASLGLTHRGSPDPDGLR